jgi:transcriptional regulator with XRE-family HTH domain
MREAVGNCSQEQLADVLGVGLRTVQRTESGTRAIDLLYVVRCCAHFGVDIDTLFGNAGLLPERSEVERTIKADRSLNPNGKDAMTRLYRAYSRDSADSAGLE